MLYNFQKSFQNNLKKKDLPFVFDEKCVYAFQKLKDALVTTPILGYPAPDGEYFLDTDASNFAISGVLSQMQYGQERVIGYFSRALTKEEKRYCTTRREL